MQPFHETSHNDILMDADRLRNNNAQKRIIISQITDILQSIKEEIRDAYRGGLHEIDINLPITFSIPNTSNADAQRIIWGSILDSLTRKNYRVRLYPNDTKCILHITWLSREDESEIEYQTKLIARATRSSE